MKKTYFLTGVTGFLGEEILRLLAVDPESEVYCLIRKKAGQSPEERLDLIKQSIGEGQNDGIKAVSGDIVSEGLGIEEDVYQRLTAQVTDVIHSAADVRFNQELEGIRKSNVNGTRHICEFASDCNFYNPDFSQLNYIGTAFVAGRRPGLVGEHELSNRFGFKNTYEQSKNEAEVVVRSFMEKGLATVIFRPSIVLGVSETGRAKEGNVIYPILKTILGRKIPAIPVNKRTTLDLVPVDFVARAMVHIAANPENRGQAFHLAAGPEGNIRLDRLVDVVFSEFNKKRPILFPTFFWKYLVRPLLNRFKPSVYGAGKENVYASYRNYAWEKSPIFSTENCRRALADSDIQVPDVETVLLNCLTFAKETKFGKKSVA